MPPPPALARLVVTVQEARALAVQHGGRRRLFAEALLHQPVPLLHAVHAPFSARGVATHVARGVHAAYTRRWQVSYAMQTHHTRPKDTSSAHPIWQEQFVFNAGTQFDQLEVSVCGRETLHPTNPVPY